MREMIAALIIAAGKTAAKENFNPQKEVGVISAIERVVLLFKRAGLERIVVVCDEYEEEPEKLTSHLNVVFIHCRHGREMLDNVKTGLAYLQDKCTAVMITHSDIPMFSIETIHALMAAEGAVCMPAYQGKTGHPILLRAEHFQQIYSYTGDGGLAGAIYASGLERSLVEVDDEGILMHVTYDENYEHLIAEHSLRRSYPDLRLRIVREKAFYGPGAHQLLQLTEETGSLREACRWMGISYGKGRGIVALMEQQLGYRVIKSQQGGSTGGYSTVTEKGKELMSRYSAYSAAAKQYLEGLFKEYFPE